MFRPYQGGVTIKVPLLFQGGGICNHHLINDAFFLLATTWPILSPCYRQSPLIIQNKGGGRLHDPAPFLKTVFKPDGFRRVPPADYRLVKEEFLVLMVLLELLPVAEAPMLFPLTDTTPVVPPTAAVVPAPILAPLTLAVMAPVLA